MAKTSVLPASAMRSPASTKADITGLNFSQIPGAATQVSAAADGSLWVLSTQPSGSDKYIYHYVGGTWTNLPGLATHLAAGANGDLYAINSSGGTYLYHAGSWTGLGGGASAITAAADGSVYVASNNGPGPDQPIWHYTTSWQQAPGMGALLAASIDTGSYTTPGGPVNPNGMYVVNSIGGIYYLNGSVYSTFLGAASSIAPTANAGFFVLAYPTNSGGNPIYYYDLKSPGWSAFGGAGVSISAGPSALFVVGASGAIYTAPLSTPITLSPTVLNFSAVQQTQTFTASEPGYAGTFSASSSDTTIATVTPATGSTGSFTVKAIAPGTASITVHDLNSGTASLNASLPNTSLPIIIPASWTVTPTSVSLSGSGQTQTITVTEAGYTGTFRASIGQSIATVSPTSGAGPFTVTGGVSSGTTTLTLTDSHGVQASIPVANTITTIPIQ